MISLKQLKADLTQKWPRLYLSCGLLDENQRFPLKVSLKSPNNQTILDDWQSVKSWAAVYVALNQTDFKLEWQTRITPLGKQELPVSVSFATVDNLAQFLKMSTELKDYRRCSVELSELFPALRVWCLRFPAKVLQAKADWNKLLRVLQWFVQHPAPNYYLREIALPEVDSKFIESYKTLLNEWLLVLQSPVCDHAKSFEVRWGFKSKPDRLRFRFLGSESVAGLQDLEVPLAEVAGMDWQALDIEKVFITENEINFLSFPKVEKSVILFGKGYGFEHWRDQTWLKNLPIFYWGDIDTHGFAILNQLRQVLPQVCSLLMDESTILAHRSFWGREPNPSKAENLDCLTHEEIRIYQGLMEHRWQENFRLEQERIALPFLKQRLETL